MSLAWPGLFPIRPFDSSAGVNVESDDMNSNFLRLSLFTAVALLIMPLTSEATSYTFDVDAASGIGTGSFTIDLPDTWPGNFTQPTLIPASSVRGFFVRGDKWTALTVTLNEFLIEHPDNAELSGGSKKSAAFKIPSKGVGLSPVDAVADLPGVTLRQSGVTQSEINRQRKSPLLDKYHLPKAGLYWGPQKPRVTSATGLTDRHVEPKVNGDLRSRSPSLCVRVGETALRRRQQNAVPAA